MLRHPKEEGALKIEQLPSKESSFEESVESVESVESFVIARNPNACEAHLGTSRHISAYLGASR